MSDAAASSPSSTTSIPSTAPPVRKRPKPGERRVQVLQALAAMLEQPGAERITTAALAARLDVSEAALYRHFASKAQMFEGLIEFIEQSVFTLINQIIAREDGAGDAGRRQAAKIVGMLVQFAEKNPGMARVMVGDALGGLLLALGDLIDEAKHGFFDELDQAFKHLRLAGKVAVQRGF